MAATPETKAKIMTKKVIADVCCERGLTARIDWHAGTGFTSTLDATGVISGHPFVCEVKRFDEEGELTQRQRMDIQRWRDAGAYVHVLEDETALLSLRYWLETLEPREPHDP
jgi:hypothetical protein